MDWKRFFDSIGLNGTRWQWKIMLWQRKLKQGGRSTHGYGGGSAMATNILLILNLAFFTAMVLRGMFYGGVFNALLHPGSELLVISGGQWWPWVLEHHQWWRCISYAFTHAGLIHIGFNMMVLYQIGPQLEREIGSAGFISVYVLCTVCATLLGLFWHPDIVVVGASGALFGLIGFSISYFHRVGGQYALAQRDFMLKWALFAFVFGFMVGADNAAHLGGALCGLACGALFPITVRGRQNWRVPINVVAIICTVATGASLAMVVATWVVYHV